MRKQLKLLLFVVALLTLVMMTMIFVSAETTGEETTVFTPGDGDTRDTVEAAGGVFDEANYNFKVVDKDGNVIGYYINLGSKDNAVAGGAWAAVPEGGTLLLLKDVNYGAKTTFYMINPNSFTFDGQGFKVTGKPNWKMQNGVDYEVVEGEGVKAGSGTAVVSDNTIKICNLTVNGSNAVYELIGAGTTYQFENTVTTSTSYGYHMNADNVTLELLGDKNVNTSTDSRMFHILKPATIIVKGGTYTMKDCTAADYSFFYIKAKANITIDGGNFSINSQRIRKTNSKGNLADTNTRICMFLFLDAAEVTVNGGTFKADLPSKTSNMIHVATGTKNASGFDVIFTVNDGKFLRNSLASDGDYGNAMFCVYEAGSAAQFNINGGYFKAPSCIFQTQNNTVAEINITDGEFYVPEKTTITAIRVDDGAEVEETRSYTGQAIIWYYNGVTFTRTINGANVTNSVNVTGGTFNNANKAMPIVYANKKVTQGTASAPIKLSFSNVTFDACGRLMVLSAKAASYYDVTIDNVTYIPDKSSRDFITAEGTGTVVSVTISNSTVKANDLFYTNSTASISAEVESGSYTLTGNLCLVGASVNSELSIYDGAFAVSEVGNLYDAKVDLIVDAGEFIVGKFDENTIFDDIDEIFAGTDATIKGTYLLVLNDGATHEFAEGDMTTDLENLFTDYDYVTVTGYAFEISDNTTLKLTGGNYVSYGDYLFLVHGGKVEVSDATLEAPYGSIVKVTTASASVDLTFTNCNLTSGGHMFRGALTGGASMAKFHLTIDGGNYTSGSNITSFGACADAQLTFKSGNFTADGMIIYTGTIGKYEFLGGTYTTTSYFFDFVPSNAAVDGKYDITVSDVVVDCRYFIGCDHADSTVNLSLKNVRAYLTGSYVFGASEEKTGVLNVTLENTMLVITREEGTAVELIKALADYMSLTMNGNVTIVVNADLTLPGDQVIDANAPAVKFGGKPYRAFFSSKADDSNITYAADLYTGSDALGGIRFMTMLSPELVALAKAAQTPVVCGTLIAPADYVIAAGAFKKEAIDAKFGSEAGVLKSGKNTYVDVVAKNSVRDKDGDGFNETFSATLVNLTEANYGRAFAAVAYVVIDGTTYYSSFNTLDQACSAKAMAEDMIESGDYAGDEDVMAILKKYAGVVEE